MNREDFSMLDSDIVFFEHIGRSLAVRGDNQKRKEELERRRRIRNFF